MADQGSSNVMPKENPNWLNNSIQFPRLIADAEALGIFEGQRLLDLATEMDLTIQEACVIIERAQSEWDQIKANTCSKNT